MKRQRYQSGYIYEAGDGFYVRYRANGVQLSHFLVSKEPQYIIRRVRGKLVPCTELKQKRDAFMLTVNTPQPSVVREMKIADFWQTYCLGYFNDNRRASTVDGYKQLWRQLLKPHFGERMLSEYRRADAQLFVESLTKTYGRRSILHIKNLASGIFQRAVELEFVELNVWQQLDMKKILHNVPKPASTPHYTLPEFKAIVAALDGHTDAQLVMMLAFYCALRPEEIAGLQWGDFQNNHVHIRRAVVRGRVGTTKTEESMQPLPLNRFLAELSTRWQQQSANTAPDAWVFPNSASDPIDLRELSRRVIVPILKAKGITWKGYYAARRGGITAAIELTNGNVTAGQELARHKNAATTTAFYKKHTPLSLRAGVAALEAAAAK